MKLQKRFRHQHYFYYGQLLDGVDANVSLFGIAFRTSIPLVCGSIAGIFAVIYNFAQLPRFYGLATGFLTGFLCVWPAILCPEQINPRVYIQKIKLLYLMRFMFVILYSVLGYMGGEFVSLFFQLAAKFTKFSIDNWIDARGIITNLISTFLAFLIAAAIGGGIQKVRQRTIQ